MAKMMRPVRSTPLRLVLDRRSKRWSNARWRSGRSLLDQRIKGYFGLDLQMHDTHGFQVMESLKAEGFEDHLPVIVLTAPPALKFLALKDGATGIHDRLTHRWRRAPHLM
jgi:FixJ family two-component response regulator